MKILIILLLSLNANAAQITINNTKLNETALKNKIESIMDRFTKEYGNDDDYEIDHLCDGRYEGKSISDKLDDDIVETCTEIEETYGDL